MAIQRDCKSSQASAVPGFAAKCASVAGTGDGGWWWVVAAVKEKEYAGHLWRGAPRYRRCDEEGRGEISILDVRVRILPCVALNLNCPALKMDTRSG